MFPGQPAENSEKLRVGDIIMAANDVSLAGKTSRDAINVLRDQPTRVVLTVKRDSSSIPPGLLRRGSFSQSLDPNEVLSAIHSRLDRDDSAYVNEPGNEESSPREIHDPHEIYDPHASASRKSSNAKGDIGGNLQDKPELPHDGVRTNRSNYVHEATSLDKGRTYTSSNGLQEGEQSRIWQDESELPRDGIGTNGGNYGHDDTLLGKTRVNRSISELADNEPGSQTPTRHLSNNGSIASENYHRARGPAETVGLSSLVTSDEKHVVPGSKFRDGFSADSISDNQIVEGGDVDQRFKSLEPEPMYNTRLAEEQVPSPLQGGVFSTLTGGDAGDESGKARKRKSSLGRTVQSDKKERLAPDEEVCLIILKT